MRYLVVFEEATAAFDHGATPPLLLYRDGRKEAPPCSPETGYEGEVNHFLDLLGGRIKKSRLTLEDALATTRLLEAEQESMRRGMSVKVR